MEGYQLKKLAKLLSCCMIFVAAYLLYPLNTISAGNSCTCQRKTYEPVSIPQYIWNELESIKQSYNSERSASFTERITTTKKDSEDISPFAAPYFGTKARLLNIINSRRLPDPKQKLEVFKKIYELLEEGKKLETQLNPKTSRNIRYGNVKNVIASLDSSPKRVLEIKCIFFDDTFYIYRF